MTFGATCSNCGEVRRERYVGWLRGNARETFADQLRKAGWREIGVWYCGQCSRGAELAAATDLGAKGG